MAGHTESDFEATIEVHLLSNGSRHGSPTDYDEPLGLHPVQLIGFVQDTQPKTCARLTERHGNADEMGSHVVHAPRRGSKVSHQRNYPAAYRPPARLTGVQIGTTAWKVLDS
jgi:type I restriction enzyme R subunit